MTGGSETRPNIVVVDDQPANLKLMEDMLRQQGYVIRSFPRGRLALSAVEQEPPDLILLDINMPEMDGFEVCERLKSIKKLALVPVIFLSALNQTEDKIKAFRSGGVDYITKPFQVEEVQARVETHLELQRARRAERDLLEQTLNGAIRTLTELVQLTAPVLTERAEAIRKMVVHMASRLEVEEPWQYELAAILCLIGCIALPVDTFERAYAGEMQPEKEKQMFAAHPENGSRLVARIPRLEGVAEMIRCQQTVSDHSLAPRDAVESGSLMLRIATELDRRVLKGAPFKAALRQLVEDGRSFPSEILKALEDYAAPDTAFDLRRLPAQELRVSMILEDDLLTKDGHFMILQKGTTLSPALLERVRNFQKARGISEPIYVRVMRSEGVHAA